MFATRNVYIFTSYFLGLACLIFVSFTPITSQAGLFSAIAKLGKTAKTIDAPDVHLTPFRFADEIAGYPKGSVAEINYSYSQNQWMAKTPDGTTVSIDEFATSAAKANQHPTLFISERDLPTSDHIFNRLPADINIKIKAKNGKIFELLTHDYPPSLLYQNIKVAVNDSMSLKTAIWQLQRPISTSKLRFIQFADNANTPLPSNVYGSKISIDNVGADQLLKSISKLRQETLVIAGKVENGVLIHGKQQASIAELEKVAADRDVSLVILGADNPPKMLQQLVKEWQVLKDNNALLSYSTGDFYNTFQRKMFSLFYPLRLNLQENLA